VPRLFGTDGVRGVAGVDLTPELAVALAEAAAAELGSPGSLVVVGRDPRPSGEFLQAAVVAGLLASGLDVVTLGVIPTAAVALATARGIGGGPPPAFGVVISASHNPMPDNGIKFFAAGGGKLTAEVEASIEARLDDRPTRTTGERVGRLRDHSGDVLAWYVDELLAATPNSLAGLRVVVDCANGAAVRAAPAVFAKAGADVVVINDDASGYRINERCGATDLDSLRTAVRAHGADAGLALDGDADRCLAVDAAGDVVDGDAILAILAVAAHERGALRGDAVVTTVMSNLGFRTAMRARGIAVVETDVGDRNVREQMVARGLVLGGEQSGHVVLLEHGPTGDGLLTGLHVLARMSATARPLAELAAVMQRLPQELVSVPVVDRAAALAAAGPVVAAAQAELGDSGRVLVRASGTEPVVRVMVEAQTSELAAALAGRIAASLAAGPA
jgi:phosphoglucosamine mutase